MSVGTEMRNTLLLAFVLVWACGAQTGSSKAPVYRLLYSPTSQVPGAQPIVMFEVTPGLFYLLSALEGPSYGASVFTLTGSGKFNLVYSLQPYTQSYTLVQATNGMLYGPGFIGQSNANISFYFSLDPSGQNPQQYPFPGKSGSLWQTLVVPPGKLYDIVAANPTQSKIFGEGFRRQVRDMKIQEVLSAPQSPWQRAYVERLIGSIRRECLDHVIVFSEASLRRMLCLYFSYYHGTRPHLALEKDAPEPRPIQPPELGRVVAVAQVGGLHHRYERRAA
jgi:hypothetical protein